MAEDLDEPRRIGEIIRRARVLARRSQADVAAALGYHQSKLSRLEGGQGATDTRVLRAVATELRISLNEFGLAPSPAADGGDTDDMHRRTFLAAGVASLAAPASPSGASYGDLIQALLPGTSPSLEADPGDLDRLKTRTAAVRRLFAACDYATLEARLPPLIRDLRAAAVHSSEAGGLLAGAYQTSVSLLLKHRDHGHAWLAVGRAMAEAERCGDPAILASSVRVHAHLLSREHHSAQALTLLRHTADQLSGSYDRRSPHDLAAYGMLLLRGVTVASVGGDRSTVKSFLAEATEVARHVNVGQADRWFNFGPTNVRLHALNASVNLGDAGQALEIARPLMRDHIPAPERRAALWIDTAQAYSQQGRLADAYQSLRIAESCAAQDIRRPAVRELVADMAARDRRRALPELHRFSRHLGVPA